MIVTKENLHKLPERVQPKALLKLEQIQETEMIVRYSRLKGLYFAVRWKDVKLFNNK